MLLVAGIFGLASAVFAWHFTSASHVPIGPPPPELGATSVTFAATDGLSLSGWYAPARAERPTVVLLHGYRSTRQSMLSRALWLHAQGFGVLLYDARGCGASAGSLRSVGYYERADLLGALAFLRESGVQEAELVGVSQGGATILLAAEQLPPLVRAVVCESVYDELVQAVDRRYRALFGVPGWLGGALMVPIAERRLGFSLADVRPIDHIGHLPCPLLMLAGELDTRTWPEDSRRLFDAARAPKQLWMIDGAAHQDLFELAGAVYRERVLSFLMQPAQPVDRRGLSGHASRVGAGKSSGSAHP